MTNRWKQGIEALSARAQIDRGLVGITFIDVLFALVVGQVLEPLVAWDDLTLESFLHMGVAFVLTVASWIGYHNSLNRPHYYIGFVNLPLAQFVVDALLVIVYWLTAIYIEGKHPYGGGDVVRDASARPEATLVAVSFLLYVVWDSIAKSMRYSSKYRLFRKDLDKPGRRAVSQVCLLISVGLASYSWLDDSTGRLGTALIDVGLILLLVGYRIAKEVIGGRPTISDEETLEDDFQLVLDRIDKIQRQLRERGEFRLRRIEFG